MVHSLMQTTFYATAIGPVIIVVVCEKGLYCCVSVGINTHTMVVQLPLIPTQRGGEGKGTLPKHACCKKASRRAVTAGLIDVPPVHTELGMCVGTINRASGKGGYGRTRTRTRAKVACLAY